LCGADPKCHIVNVSLEPRNDMLVLTIVLLVLIIDIVAVSNGSWDK
jgi:hypothetical protein